MEERLVYTQEVGSSRLSPPTTFKIWGIIGGIRSRAAGASALSGQKEGRQRGTPPPLKARSNRKKRASYAPPEDVQRR